MTHNIVVKRVGIHDAKTNLSRYLRELEPGEAVLCNRNQLVAELRTLRKKVVPKPKVGAAAGKFVLRTLAGRNSQSFRQRVTPRS